MATFGLTIAWIYFIGMLIAWAYFWFSKTNSSQSPIARRTVALGHAVIWPITVIKSFTKSSAAASAKKQADIKAAEERILRDNATGNNQPNAPRAQGGSSIKNPFDD